MPDKFATNMTPAVSYATRRGPSGLPLIESQGHSSAFAVAGGCPASLVRAMLNHFIASQELHAADKRGDGTYPAAWDSWLLTLAAVEKEWVAWTQDNSRDQERA